MPRSAPTPADLLSTVDESAKEFEKVAGILNSRILTLEDRLQALAAKTSTSVDSPEDLYGEITRYKFDKYGGNWRLIYRVGVKDNSGKFQWKNEKFSLLMEASLDQKIEAVAMLVPLVEAINANILRLSDRVRSAADALEELIPDGIQF